MTFTKVEQALAKAGYVYHTRDKKGQLRAVVRDLTGKTYNDVIFCYSDYQDHAKAGICERVACIDEFLRG